MTGTSIEFGLVVARRRLHGPWASQAWLPVRAITPVVDVAPWTRLGQDGDDELFYAGRVSAELHRPRDARNAGVISALMAPMGLGSGAMRSSSGL